MPKYNLFYVILFCVTNRENLPSAGKRWGKSKVMEMANRHLLSEQCAYHRMQQCVLWQGDHSAGGDAEGSAHGQ